MLVFSSHYRQPLDYNDEALEAAAEGVRRLGEFRERLVGAARVERAERAAALPALPAIVDLQRSFAAALDDDLNAPQALAAVFTFVRAVNRDLDAGALAPSAVAAALGALDQVMAVLDVIPAKGGVDERLKAWVEGKIRDREAARRAREFARADAIRAEILARGVELEDTPAGTRWKVRQAYPPI
jgi:cysteinyl-tRNA synthetase